MRAPATPAVLAWARETAGYTLEQAAEGLKIASEDLASWEAADGDERPTAATLGKIAKLYKRPLALFFFPKPPPEPPATKKFRTLPEADAFTPDTLLAIREASARQLALSELTAGKNPAENLLPRVLRPAPNENVRVLASRIRDTLELTQELQRRWKNAEEAFKWCRDAIEANGVFVFKRHFKQPDVSGFCLTDAEFPIIYVNNAHAFERQLFTLFHELAHLIYHVDGVTAGDERVEQQLIADKRLEVRCNALAGEVLVPTPWFRTLAKTNGTDEAGVSTIAKFFSVSREVILRRAVDLGLLPPSEYRSRVDALGSGFARKGSDDSGGNYYRTQAAYLGQSFLRLAFSRLNAGLVTEAQMAQYTGVKARNLPKLEDLVADKA